MARTQSVAKMARQPKPPAIRAPATGPNAGTKASMELNRP